MTAAWVRVVAWIAAAAIVSALVYVARYGRDIVELIHSGERVRTRRPALALVAVIIALTALNYAAALIPARLDLTANGSYRLSPQTRQTLRRLASPVRLQVFAHAADIPAIQDRLEEYEKASSRVSAEYVNVDEQPDLARLYDIPASGATLVAYNNRVQRVVDQSEDGLTNALIGLIENRTLKIYFTTGHAERDISSSERAGYNTIAGVLSNHNFIVSTTNVALEGKIPGDATALILAGPRTDLFGAEAEMMEAYLRAGGKILLLVDPPEDLKRYITESGTALFMMDALNAAATSGQVNLRKLVGQWRVQIGNDVVVDGSGVGQYFNTDASVPIGVTYPAHPVTEGLTSLTAFPIARSISVLPDATGGRTRAQSIVQTGAQTWTQADLKRLAASAAQVQPGPDDPRGPISLGVAAWAPAAAAPAATDGGAPESRVVVIGDSDFVANYMAGIPGNEELFVNAVRWLSQQERRAVIPARPLADRRLNLDGNARRNLSWLALFFVPVACAGVAMFLWTKGQP